MPNKYTVGVHLVLLKQVSRWLLLDTITEIYDLLMNKGDGYLPSSLLSLIFHKGAGNKDWVCGSRACLAGSHWEEFSQAAVWGIDAAGRGDT